MKLLVDMNLSPEWVAYLRERGFAAIHWSAIGAHHAPDSVVIQWARDHEHIVFTHDLDFGILLAHSRAGRPSVIQVRAQDVAPSHLGPLLVAALRIHGEALTSGALLTVDEAKSRVRILPI